MIAFVGESADTIRAHLREAHESGALPALPRVVLPGEDAWWDKQWRWPSLGERECRRGQPTEQDSYFVIEPLLTNTWSPQFADALLRYALVQATGGSSAWRSLWRALRKPAVTVSIARELSAIERAELVDVLRDVSVGVRVVLEPNEHVGRPPVLPIDILYWSLGAALVALGCLYFIALRAEHPAMFALFLPVAGVIFGLHYVKNKRALVARRRV